MLWAHTGEVGVKGDGGEVAEAGEQACGGGRIAVAAQQLRQAALVQPHSHAQAIHQHLQPPHIPSVTPEPIACLAVGSRIWRHTPPLSQYRTHRKPRCWLTHRGFIKLGLMASDKDSSA